VRCSSTCGDTSSSTKADEGLPCVSNRCVGHCVYGEEHVSLNEVVIERGISPFLTNLECFCDGTFVTHVQVCCCRHCCLIQYNIQYNTV